MHMKREEILGWLLQDDAGELELLWEVADRTRREVVGEEVHLRGLVEISNHCVRRCGYCGINAGNASLKRYRMTAEEIVECASLAASYGYGTVVLQAGEDPGIARDWMAGVVREIKSRWDLAVTLSLGEREDGDLLEWRKAGADRYLLRFETSDRELYDAIHPPRPGWRSDRFAMLGRLKGFGYEVGSGVMVGIPGQSFYSLSRDIELFGELELDMIGVGPYILHPMTDLASNPKSAKAAQAPDHRQVPPTELMTLKVVALARLVRPDANIPSTTALATVNRASGRELGLRRGANVVMPNLTPAKYRALYEIYPDKACLTESAGDCAPCVKGRIESIGRRPGVGRGGRGCSSQVPGSQKS